MRRKLIAATVLALFTSLFMVQTALAGPYDSVFSQATFSTLVEYDKTEISAFEMRGFCSSADGKYLFGGLLQDIRRVIKIDAATGEPVGEYSDDEPGYPKGLCTDDRGYLYVGLANAANDGAVNFAIVEVSTMNEVKFVSTEIDGKVGVNGVYAVRLGEKYYLYLITNYDTDRLYRFDVTNPSNPVVDSSFGKNSGYTDLQELFGNAGCDANYLAVDGDGIIYMTAKVENGSKGDTVLKISADGKSIISKTALTEPYGIYLRDGYLLVSTYNGTDSIIYVINTSDLSVVCEIGNMDDSARYSGVTIAGDKIYISDQGYGLGDRILVSNKLEFPVPQPETAPATNTPATEQTISASDDAPVTGNSATAPVTTAAQTGDYTMVSVVLLAAASTALAISRKRK
jgi:hypothetical protein